MRRLLIKLPLIIASTCALTATFSAHAQINDSIYDDCLNQYNTINNSIVAICSQQASFEYKKNITTDYKKIYAVLKEQNPDDAQKMEESEIAWLEYRNKYCELAGSYIGSPMYDYCPMELNKTRALQLEEMASGL